MYRTRASPDGMMLNLMTPSATNSSTPVHGKFPMFPVPSSVINRVVQPDAPPTRIVQIGPLALEHGHIHARLLRLLRAVVQEMGSEDGLPGPGPPGEGDQATREEPAFEHPIEFREPGRCALVRARLRRPRHRDFGHAINLFLALCMERATVSKKSACGARRRMWTGTGRGGSPCIPLPSLDNGTS